MSTTLEAESTLTDRYQTTVPEAVRRALRLDKRDKIHYSVRSTGEVVLTRAIDAESSDPVLGQFLDFLAHTIATRPESLQGIDSDFIYKIRSLVESTEVDLNAPLSADDE